MGDVAKRMEWAAAMAADQTAAFTRLMLKAVSAVNSTRETSIRIDDNDVGYMCACCGGRPAGKMARLHDYGDLICRGCVEAALMKLDGG